MSISSIINLGRDEEPSFYQEFVDFIRKRNPYLKTDAVDIKTGKVTRIGEYERTHVTDKEYQLTSKILADIDEENIKQPTEEKVYQAAFRMIGVDYIDDPEEREQLFLDNPEIYDKFLEKYEVADYAMGRKMGGQDYNKRPPPIIFTKRKGSSKIGTIAVLGLIGGAIFAGVSYISNDADGDGVSNYDEMTKYGTNPHKADTDDDGIPDGVEIKYFKNPDYEGYTHPLIPDMDKDGLLDGEEVNKYFTMPRNPDSDGDGIPDGDEVKIYLTNPLSKDTDKDYITDPIEINELKTNPNKLDTDGDGIEDFPETYLYNLNPNDPEDGREFIEKIPYVEVNSIGGNEGGTFRKTPKVIDTSLRDPLVHWYAKNTEIKWEIENDEEVGKIIIPNVPNYEPEEWPNSSVWPAYQLTHGRKGTCGPQSYWNSVILEIKGYKILHLGGYVPTPDGPGPHGWIEAHKDGETYVVSWGRMFPRDDFYEKKGWTLEEDYACAYNPNWYKEQ